MPARLLDPLTPDQQKLVDLVADAFLVDEGKWPFFDYLEGKFDEEHKDAWEVLYSLPRVGAWNYGLAWWVGINQPFLRPSAEQEIELTIVGMHHSPYLQEYVGVFFRVLEVMIDKRRRGPVARRKARDVSVGPEELRWDSRRAPLLSDTLKLIPTLLSREPGTWASGTNIDPDGNWTKVVPRSVLDYEGITTIEAYVDRVEALTTAAPTPPVEVVASPLGLAAALDYLDVTWRVVHNRPLFLYPSAERAAKLTYAVNTAEEFDSRLTGLGEILRTANKTARETASQKLAAVTHDEPLAPFRDFVGSGASDRGPIDGAVDILEAALSIRDAAQHTEAGGRAVRTMSLLGVQHPVGDYANAWSLVSAHLVTALNTLRERITADSNI
jgi:hypothetical protein